MDEAATQEERQRLAREWRATRAALLDAALGPEPGPIWCPVANIVPERAAGPGGLEVQRGTRLFAPNAKIYSFPPMWDTGGDYATLMVVGCHRASHRYLTTIIAARYLTNWRTDLVYSPRVIRELVWEIYERYYCWRDMTVDDARAGGLMWDGTPASKERAEALVARMLSYFPQARAKS